MLTQLNSNEFSVYTQTLKVAEPGDEYTRLKIIKERNKALHLLNSVLPTREMIISWKEDGVTFSTIATLNTTGFNNLPELPNIPESFDDINGTKVSGQKHVHFYARPEMTPVLIEIDSIDAMVVCKDGIDELILETALNK